MLIMKAENQISGKIENEENNERVSIQNACLSILFGNTIQSKTIIYKNAYWNHNEDEKNLNLNFSKPGRPQNLHFTDKKIKFPKDHEFKNESSRAKAIHFFANHELLAIEVMAKMLLILPNDEHSQSYKEEIWKTLQDEQKHLWLYKTHIEKLGFYMGAFPVNDYFWKAFKDVIDFKSYFSLMALTFETANLDFASFYSNLFLKIGDFEGKLILDKIYNDEVFHVKLGIKYFNDVYSQKSLWNNYVESLPWPLTPARSRGIHYQRNHRINAGYSNEFIDELESFNDNFKITDRKR